MYCRSKYTLNPKRVPINTPPIERSVFLVFIYILPVEFLLQLINFGIEIGGFCHWKRVIGINEIISVIAHSSI